MDQNKEKFAVLVHRLYSGATIKKGGADYIVRYLESKGHAPIYVEHPLNTSGPTFVRIGDQERAINLLGSGPIRWPQEVIVNILELIKLSDLTYILAVDPLNFFGAWVTKLVIRPELRIHFHSVDYSDSRFSNPTLDFIYNQLYKFAVMNADVVTFVSRKAEIKIGEMTNGKAKGFLYFLPNSPEFNNIPKIKIENKKPGDLIYTKSFISDLEIDLMLKVVEEALKVDQSCSLHLAGNVSDSAKEKINKNKNANHVKCFGLVSYEKNIEILSKCAIGLAWYEGKNQFERYADSLKIREYAASGLPTICNDVVSTCHELEEENAGVMVKNEEEFIAAVKDLINDRERYVQYSKNALEWSMKFDKAKLLDNLYPHLFYN
ncbi:hypothetical protein A2415_00750 [candidate division WWE3 bacterium RIFOXYC1_FULL_39_7]|uniref:Glycosyl transferase family 1 domain-containing protein n=2 Tax=Katanobacteria TaxID=422282 RepID=A0A1F4X6N5_UNCKA|nr:MAG: hypothetical protein A2415_00750 [candidate division WWE3 bacterium RIFOXYC1_FULL_39_7]OGC77328.1 MAG: hypothetical protein A2619_04805 [candidate division WWE3 bacterium RIFOXYD1_FULL_39_9]